MTTASLVRCGVVVVALLAGAAAVAAAQGQAQAPAAADQVNAPADADQANAPAAAGDEGAELAKKLSNPIADLVSVPFQMNWENGIGVNDQTRYILNVQPVMPFSLNKDWNMIARVIMPFINQPPIVAGIPGTFGLGDVLTSLFFSPANSTGFTWGAGPVISLPSTTQPTLGTEKWSAGPTVVILKQESGWTYGALVNQVWSFAGNRTRADVSQMFLQPFLAYTTKTLWTLTVQSESTADWEADSSNRWNVPVNLLVAKLSTFGTFPASYQVGGGVFVAKPDNSGATWKVRAAVTILMPRKK